jgi:D-3-phosphoglycerate dehydrogenase
MTRPIVFVAEPLAPEGITVLREGGADVRESYGLTREALVDALHGAGALIVRSKTIVDAALLDSAP